MEMTPDHPGVENHSNGPFVPRGVEQIPVFRGLLEDQEFIEGRVNIGSVNRTWSSFGERCEECVFDLAEMVYSQCRSN